ncbi:MAG: cytochrome b [Pseudolabrys sp.]
MQIFNSPERYGAVVKLLHWMTALLIIAGWLLGTFGEELPRGAARDAAMFFHVSAGLAVFAVIVLRLVWRIADRMPAPEPGRFAVLLHRAAALGHLALYAFVLAVPLVGVVLQFARGEPLPLFGIAEIASPWAADRGFAHSVEEVHEFLANALVVLALLHAAAALMHHWVFRDNTLRRMLPGSA